MSNHTKKETKFQDSDNKMINIMSEFMKLPDDEIKTSNSEKMSSPRELIKHVLATDGINNQVLPYFPNDVWYLISDYCVEARFIFGIEFGSYSNDLKGTARINLLPLIYFDADEVIVKKRKIYFHILANKIIVQMCYLSSDGYTENIYCSLKKI
jgi:hypothetical protein